MAQVPLLRTRVAGTGIRLELGTWNYGHGRTVEEAADDLVERLLRHAIALRSGGFRLASESPPPDHGYLEFLWELREMNERGDDVRGRIFRPGAEQ